MPSTHFGVATTLTCLGCPVRRKVEAFGGQASPTNESEGTSLYNLYYKLVLEHKFTTGTIR